MITFPQWFDKNCMLCPDPQPATCDNPLLFLALYIRLKDLLGEEVEFNKSQIENAIVLHLDHSRNVESADPDMLMFKLSPWEKDGERDMSHDNMTALIYLSKRFGLKYHKMIKIFGPFLHPTYLILYSYEKYAWLRPFLFFLLWIPMLHMLQSNFKKWKVRDHGKFLHTEGKFMFMLRMGTRKMWLTNWLGHKILKWRWGPYCWHVMFTTYFKHPCHPTRHLSSKVEI